MMLDLTEDADFYFDPDAADRPVRFTEKFCQHHEGAFAGQPFKLHPAQRCVVRDLYGWKWKRGKLKGCRRYTDCYLEGAVGSGKSPLLAALGLYGLTSDGEPGAQIYSLASTFGQARIVFDTAKKFIRASDPLSRRLEVLQYEIRDPRTDSFWRIVSGKGPGAGCRPHLVLGDEVHQWPGAGAYKDLRDRMAKRRQPLMITATNAPTSRATFAWQLREKAVAALDGKGPPTLYPVIWCAGEEAETDDPGAWRDANPLLGITIDEEKVAAECAEAMKDQGAEADFRRLYLGITPKTAGGRWLDLNLWDACTGPPAVSAPESAPMYVGLDLSQSDDLCAAVWILVSPDRFYAGCHFWLPLKTAEHYQAKDAVPYLEWAAKGYLTLLNEPTVSPDARREIASTVVGWAKDHPVKAVCFDRYRSDETVIALEAAGLTCVPVAQGFTVSPGCYELERRLKEQSITVAPSPVLRFCAENATVKGDDRGNIWVAKPNARGWYAGRRGAKIDGITALVTALTEARKHNFPAAAKKWKGGICLM